MTDMTDQLPTVLPDKHDVKEELFVLGEHEDEAGRAKLIAQYRERYPTLMPEIESIVIDFWNYLPGNNENSVAGLDTEDIIRAAFEGFDFSTPAGEKGAFAALEPGAFIDKYLIKRILGAGGMGIVYLAENTDTQQLVAIKTVRTLIDPTHLIQEQKSLAKMDSRYIAHLKDSLVGDNGLHYIVMEYVEGEKIDTYCDNRKLSIRNRILLFKQLCEGVLHAHSHNLMHLDLKPLNILVKEEGGKPLPKIIDFGISSLKGQGSDRFGKTRGCGTPAYMSPEQTNRAREELSQKSDVYSLGVILHELLCGKIPLSRELKGLPTQEMFAIVRSFPPHPLVEEARKHMSLDLAEKRGATPAKVMAQLDGELTWIVAKTLEKDPAQRYSLEALIRDLDAYLDHREVLAGAHNRAYKVKHWLRRQQQALSMVALLAIALFVSLVVLRQTALKAQAEDDAKQTREQFFAVFIRQASPFFGADRKETLSVDELMAKLSEKLNDPNAKRDKNTNYQLRFMLGRTYCDLGMFREGLAELGTLLQDTETWFGKDSREHLETVAALAYQRVIWDPKNGDPHAIKAAIARAETKFGTNHQTTNSLRTSYALAMIMDGAADLSEALAESDKALRNLDFKDPLVPRYAYAALNNRGCIYIQQAEYRKAYKDLRKVEQAYRKNLESRDPFYARILMNLGVTCFKLNNYREAKKFFERALPIFENRLGPDHALTGNVRTYLDTHLPSINCDHTIAELEPKALAGTLEENEQIVELSVLVDCFLRTQNWAKATQFGEMHLAAVKARFKPGHRNELIARINLCMAQYGAGDQSDAKMRVQEVFDQADKLGMGKDFRQEWQQFLRDL